MPFSHRSQGSDCPRGTLVFERAPVDARAGAVIVDATKANGHGLDGAAGPSLGGPSTAETSSPIVVRVGDFLLWRAEHSASTPNV